MKKVSSLLTVIVIGMVGSSLLFGNDKRDQITERIVDVILAEKVPLYTMDVGRTVSISFDDARSKLWIAHPERILDDPNLLKRDGKYYLCHEALLLSSKVVQDEKYLSVEVRGNYSVDGISYLVALIKFSDLQEAVDEQVYQKLTKL